MSMVSPPAGTKHHCRSVCVRARGKHSPHARPPSATSFHLNSSLCPLRDERAPISAPTASSPRALLCRTVVIHAHLPCSSGWLASRLASPPTSARTDKRHHKIDAGCRDTY
ncbi:uncharacterized protein BKA78DRAFT_302680 [Phyllosticta capitalensis]|uniref:uncharacterized protein n=1 Tax=Phyllosticta capitalensis TaxID=121624 RepID=UPI00312D4B88